MKFVLAIVSLCVVGTMGAKYCSYEDADNVLDNWNSMMDGGNTAPYMLAIFKDVFGRILKDKPEGRELFKRVNIEEVNSPKYDAHILRVANAFDDVLNKLHSHQVMDHMLNHLSGAHSKRTGLYKVYFELLASKMGPALEVVLDDYNPDAWDNCLSGILDGISAGLP